MPHASTTENASHKEEKHEDRVRRAEHYVGRALQKHLHARFFRGKGGVFRKNEWNLSMNP
jgi:hypothetical protein